MLKEEKAPSSLPKCPICNKQSVILETVNVKGETLEWEIICDQEDHLIQIIGNAKEEVMKIWREAFSDRKS